MAITAALANPEELKQFKRKTQSRKRPENKHWYTAAEETAGQIGIEGQMTIRQFQSVVDRWPNKRVVIFSLQSNQPIPNGPFIGSEYDPENAENNTIWILYDSGHDHFTCIINM